MDTSIFIYQMETNPRYGALTDCIFAWLEESPHMAVTSTITMTELLEQPYLRSNDAQVDEFYALLSTCPNLHWIPTSLRIADRAAGIRAAYRLRTPDALQAATAVESQTTGLITNDAAFERVKEFETLVLEDLI